MTYNPNMTYNATLPSRKQLASEITQKLTAMGFRPYYDGGTKEVIYSRPVHTSPGVTVLVYTSCVPHKGGIVARRKATDAIRVCAVYTARNGETRGLARAEKRVNRVGQTADIVGRMYQRAREVYKAAMNPCRCGSCGAPLFTSKAGNDVCAELCWLPEDQRNRPAPKRRRHPRGSYGEGVRRRRRSSYVSTAYDIECAFNGVAP